MWPKLSTVQYGWTSASIAAAVDNLKTFTAASGWLHVGRCTDEWVIRCVVVASRFSMATWRESSGADRSGPSTSSPYEVSLVIAAGRALWESSSTVTQRRLSVVFAVRPDAVTRPRLNHPHHPMPKLSSSPSPESSVREQPFDQSRTSTPLASFFFT
jgi:hypothetical protein